MRLDDADGGMGWGGVFVARSGDDGETHVALRTGESL